MVRPGRQGCPGAAGQACAPPGARARTVHHPSVPSPCAGPLLPRPLTAVVKLNLTVSEAVYRLGGRRTCYGVEPEEIIHINDEDAVSRCLERGGLLVQRPDDLPNVIVRRLTVHETDTEPLMEFYKPRVAYRQSLARQGFWSTSA